MIYLEQLSELESSSHPFFSTESVMRRLLQPVRNHFEIDEFVFGKSFHDASLVFMTSCPEYSQAYLQHKVYLSDWNRFLPSCYSKDRKIYSFMIEPEATNSLMIKFSVSEGIYFIHPVADGCEFFYFEMYNKNPEVMAKIIDEIYLLEKFVYNFNSAAKDVLSKLFTQRVKAVDFICERGNPFASSSQIDRPVFLSDIYGCKITPRDIALVKHLVVGKTAKEIAALYNLSYRTIEENISRLKEKTNSVSLHELIQRVLC